jgi:hypothetical protein
VLTARIDFSCTSNYPAFPRNTNIKMAPYTILNTRILFEALAPFLNGSCCRSSWTDQSHCNKKAGRSHDRPANVSYNTLPMTTATATVKAAAGNGSGVEAGVAAAEASASTEPNTSPVETAAIHKPAAIQVVR